MSEEVLSAAELSERVVNALARRDLDAFLELVHPEAEFRPLLAAVDGGVYRGHGAVRRWLADLWDAWEGYNPTVLGTEQVGERVVLAEILIRLRGHRSEIEIETHTWGVAVRDPSLRLIASWSFHADEDEAREAARAAAG